MSLPLEFVIDGPPVSQQTRRQGRLREWRRDVRNEAAKHWPTGEHCVGGPIMVSITYFYTGRSIDLDNVPKPIIDALKEFVFDDDDQVTDLICRKRRLANKPIAGRWSVILNEGLNRGSNFVHVIISEAPDQQVII